MTLGHIAGLYKDSRSTRVLNAVAYVICPVLMLALSEFTIERVSPAIVLSGQGDIARDSFSCQFMLRMLLVVFTLHVVRHERPGPVAATVCLANLSILQVWLIENTAWHEAWTYRLAPLAICVGVAVGALIVDVLCRGPVADAILTLVSAGALLLSHYVTRWNTLMIGFTPSPVGQWWSVLLVYLGVVLYLGVLFWKRAGRGLSTGN
ncbi:MAG: hypothetical protein HPKKFMNG_01634 [Planctomycetes bacterium]|nr:hypothetical protein [Planctomycetota bacterium]